MLKNLCYPIPTIGRLSFPLGYVCTAQNGALTTITLTDIIFSENLKPTTN